MKTPMQKIADELVRLEKRLIAAEGKRDILGDSAITNFLEWGRKINAAKRAVRKARAKLLGCLRRAANLVKVGDKPPGVCCPICGVPVRGWATLVGHLASRHGWDTTRIINGQRVYRCSCGMELKGKASMGAHLRGQKDMRSHIHVSRVGSLNGSAKP